MIALAKRGSAVIPEDGFLVSKFGGVRAISNQCQAISLNGYGIAHFHTTSATGDGFSVYPVRKGDVYTAAPPGDIQWGGIDLWFAPARK